MVELITEAIVLRRTDYRDWDRMLTLFSPEHGRIDAMARGIRKPASRMRLAGEPFATGQASLNITGDRASLTGFELMEGFYPLREDYERLMIAAQALNICSRVILPDTPDPALFALIQRTLGRLAYSDQSEVDLLARFLLGVMEGEGIAPAIRICAHCGREIPPDVSIDTLRFSIPDGGLCCAACVPFGRRIRETTLAWLRGAETADMAEGIQGDADAALSLLKLFFDNHTHIRK